MYVFMSMFHEYTTQYVPTVVMFNQDEFMFLPLTSYKYFLENASTVEPGYNETEEGRPTSRSDI